VLISDPLTISSRSLTPENSMEENLSIKGRGLDEYDDGVARLESEEGPVESVHYQSVQGGEVRNHGVGYFAFSTDMEKRKEQMELLSNLREKVRIIVWCKLLFFDIKPSTLLLIEDSITSDINSIWSLLTSDVCFSSLSKLGL